MATNSQLARIIVPPLNDASYAQGLQNAFDTINENFKKIASMPFVQGVQGDSYVSEIKQIWSRKSALSGWSLTVEGAVLLNSIFGYVQYPKFHSGYSLDKCKEVIGDNYTLNGKTPLDIYSPSGDTMPYNDLYFYVVKDDTGNEVEKAMGQYYYFVDGRVNELSTVVAQGNEIDQNGIDKLLNFNDLSGFYRYIPETINLRETIPAHYEKTSILPSLYYDADKNDICWQFNGAQTGISAIGIHGDNGKDADLSFVMVEADPNSNAGEILGVFSYDQSNVPPNAEWKEDWDKLKEGIAMICIRNVGNTETEVPAEPEDAVEDEAVQNQSYVAIGYIAQDGLGKWYAYWNIDGVFDFLGTEEKINNYFAMMGINDSMSSAHYGVEIPSAGDRTTMHGNPEYYTAHVIKTEFKDIDEENDGNDDNNLIFRLTKDTLQGASTSPTRYSENPTDAEVVLDNYALRLQKCDISTSTVTGQPIDVIDSNSPYTLIDKADITLKNGNDTTKITANEAKFGDKIFAKEVNITGTTKDHNGDNASYIWLGKTPVGNKNSGVIECIESPALNDIEDENPSGEITVGIRVDNNTVKRFNKRSLELTVGATTNGSAGWYWDNVAGIRIDEDATKNESKVRIKPELYVEDTFDNSGSIGIPTNVDKEVGVGIPIGSIIMWYGNIIKDGKNDKLYFPAVTNLSKYWVVCNGADITGDDRFTALRKICKNINKNADMTDLPNFIGRFPLGAYNSNTNEYKKNKIGVNYSTEGKSRWSYSKGDLGGEDLYQLQPRQVARDLQNGGNDTQYSVVTNYKYDKYGTLITENGHAATEWDTKNGQDTLDDTNNTPPFLAVHFLIKYR